MVTGAGGGIGAAIAAGFAAAGATVVVHYHANKAGAEAVVQRIADDGGTAFAFGGDLAGPGPHAADGLIAAAVDRTGRLDVLVNNAGLQPVVPLVAMTPAEWQEVVDTNLLATFLCTQAASRRMIELDQGGSIIHIASIEASQPAPGHAHYGPSKAAIVMHARSAALELGPYGIRVNSVSPGLVQRDGLAQAWPDGVARFHAAAPLGRLVEAGEVAAACVFLASPLAAAITGHDLVVDAGVSCHPTW